MKKYLAALLALVMVFTMAACGGGNAANNKETAVETEAGADADSNDDAKTFKIGVMPKLMGIPYFEQTGDGAVQAGKDLGVEVIYNGPTKADAAEQVKMLEDWINSGVDAIAVAPNDSAAMEPVLQKAKDAGIIVIDWDTPTESDLVSASVRQIDNQTLGEHLFDNLVKVMGKEEGNYAIVTGGLSAANLNTWIDFGTSYAAEKYPGLNLVTEKIPSDEIQQEAYTKTLDLVKAYPELDGIVGYSTVAPLGVAQAIREVGKQDEIAVVGTATKEDSQDFLSDGSLDIATLWDPSRLGYLTVGVAKALLEGKTLEDGMEIEGFGTIELQENNIIIMGPPDDYVAE